MAYKAASILIWPLQNCHVYLATITQSGTNDPIDTIIRNNLGTISWNRLTTGQYEGTTSFNLPTEKLGLLTQQRDNNGSALLFRTGTNTLALQTSIGGGYLDDLLTNTYLEIKIYTTQ